MNKYSAYLFDMDGTLVDSEKLKARALVATCRLLGGNAHENDYREVMGQSWEHVTEHYWRISGISPEITAFNSTFQPLYMDLLDRELKLTPGAKEFVQRLKGKGIKTGVVSSAFSWMVKKVLTTIEMSGHFDLIVSKENVQHHKPHPEAYIYAANQLKLMPKEVLVFEDSHAGIEAASKARCDVIAIQHDFNTGHDFSAAKEVLADFTSCRII